MIEQIDTLWSQSFIAVNESVESTEIAKLSAGDIISNICIISIISLFFLYTYKAIIYNIIKSFGNLFNSSRSLDLKPKESILDYTYAIDPIYLLSSLSLSLFAANLLKEYQITITGGILALDFAVIITAIFCYSLIRYLIASVLDWINVTTLFKKLYKLLLFSTSIGITIGLIWYLIIGELLLLSTTVALIGLFSISILSYLWYIIRSSLLIISEGFSYFFYILYLCTLEMLPIIFLFDII